MANGLLPEEEEEEFLPTDYLKRRPLPRMKGQMEAAQTIREDPPGVTGEVEEEHPSFLRRTETKNKSLFTPTEGKPNFLIGGGTQEKAGLRSLYGKKPTPNPFDTIDMEPYMPSPTPFPDEVRAITTGGKNDWDTNVVDFLFGGEMAILGFKYDNEGFTHDWEVAKQQWSEQPVWINALNSASLLGTIAFPAGRALWATSKVGGVASLINRSRGFTKADEISKFKTTGLLDNAVKDVDEKTLHQLRKIENAQTRYENLVVKLDKYSQGEGDFSMIDKIKLSFAKKFTNDYFKIAGSIGDPASDVRKNFHKNLNDLFNSEDIGKFFVNMPDEEAGLKIYQHWLNKMRPGLAIAPKLTKQEKQWADTLEVAMRRHQEDALDLGLITEDTFKRVGPLHIPALFKGTPRPDLETTRKFYVPIQRKASKKEIQHGIAGEEDVVTVLRSFEMPRMDSPTLKARKKDLPEIAERLEAGELITSPAELTTRGYVTDRLLTNNFRVVKDIITTDTFGSVAYRDAIAKYGTIRGAEKKGGLVNLETIPTEVGNTLRRILKKNHPEWLGDGDELPLVRRVVFDELFGEAGVFAQTQMQRNFLDLLTTVHKTSKTALSVPTHFQNFASNLAMLSQAGFNPITPQNVTVMGKMAKAFEKIAKEHRKAKDLGRSTRLEDVGVNLGKIKIGDKTFNLNDEILDPKVRELIEESAFESVEGFANIKRIADSLSSEQGFTKSAAEKILKFKSISQLGDKEGFRWFDQMTKAYLAEDMIPKMTYYMGLRAKGLTKEASIIEVGRRLPMYNTVGSTIKRTRRLMFPWATFPAEAVRITKNNLMDNPIRMIPWLQMPGIVQATLSATGVAPSIENVKDLKRQLPMWAQKHETIITKENEGVKLGAGATGALTGGAAGAVAGGAKGALAGAVAGGALGAGAADLLANDSSDKIRGSILDWLPHSAFLLTTTAEEHGGEVLPWKTLRGALEQSPAQPLAVFKPIMDVIAGQTAFGQEIVGENFGDQFGKAISGMVGFLSPPIIQKYGFKITTPDVPASEALTGERLPFDITNVQRLMTDVGAARDAHSGRPGNLAADFALKNLGIWKSWATDPANQLSNEQGVEENLQKVRSLHAKNLAFHLENGNDKASMRILSSVMSTFSRQYADNPRRAQEKFSDWVKSRIDAIGRHPRLRGLSKSELLERFDAMTRFASKERGIAREQMLEFLEAQLQVRRMNELRKKGDQGFQQYLNVKKKGSREPDFFGDKTPFGEGLL